MRFPLFERHPREELSAYIDNELVFQRVEAVKAHLSSCPTCRADLDALRNLKSQLAALPESPAPRSFALTPQMAQRPAPEPSRVRTPARVVALSNGMRLAGAGMAVALAVVMVLNFTSSGNDSGRNSATGAPQAFSANTSAHDDSADQSLATDLASLPGVAASRSADDQASTVEPPIATPTLAAAGAPNPGSGVGGPASGGTTPMPTFIPGSTTRPTATLIPGSTPAPTAIFGPPGIATSPVPTDANPPASGAPDKNESGLDNGLATQSALTRDLPTSQASEAAPAAGTTSDGGGGDILLLVAIALAAGVVLAFAGSVIIPRIARDDL